MTKDRQTTIRRGRTAGPTDVAPATVGRQATTRTRATVDAESRVVLAQGAAHAAIAIIQTIQIMVEGQEYRSRLREMVMTLEADQVMRHADVQYLLEVLDRFKADMSPETRDQYFLSILRLLEVTGLRSLLPAVPR